MAGTISAGGRRRVRLLVGMALLGPGLFALAGGGDRAQAAFPGTNGLIAFTSKGVDFDIWTMTPDGANLVNRTSNPAGSDIDPAWSPDGTKIAFSSDRDGDYDIYTMNADGTGQTRRTNEPGYDTAPAWSPDGTKIAFQSDRDVNLEIYTMNADGTSQTNRSQHAGQDTAPAWSPDGTKIAFSSNRGGTNGEIWMMAPDGSGSVARTALGKTASDPDWSPDGAHIAFRLSDGSSGDIHTVASDGATVNRTQSLGRDEWSPAWSPDGTRIAFHSGEDIHTMAADGSGSVVHIANSGEDFAPNWQPVVPSSDPASGSDPPPSGSPAPSGTSPSGTSPSPGSTGSAPATGGGCVVEGSPGYVHPAKLQVARSRVLRSRRLLDALAPISARAAGPVRAAFRAAGRTIRFDAKITDAGGALDRIAIRRRLSRAQARVGTGILTLRYAGDADTRPDEVRLRAASQRARLDVEQISLVGGRLAARGSVARRARGVVRLRLSYLDALGRPQLHHARARIQPDGDWKLTGDSVPAQAAFCGGYLSILFTGYERRRIRGEMLAYQLNAGQTRRP